MHAGPGGGVAREVRDELRRAPPLAHSRRAAVAAQRARRARGEDVGAWVLPVGAGAVGALVVELDDERGGRLVRVRVRVRVSGSGSGSGQGQASGSGSGSGSG